MSSDWVPRGYAVDRLIGSGASADVWRASVAATGEPVALKRIHLGVGDASVAERARDEARLLASLDHPNLVRLHDSVQTRDSLVLVLDLAERGSLRDLLAARGRLTPGEVITALAPVAAALGHLHERSVVHGDVSPANVLFATDGSPMLADVGVARLAGSQRAVQSTPAYVDPLVAAGAAPSSASDVFMLGAVAHHALTGRPLWRADGSALAALARAVGGVPTDLAERLAGAGAPTGLVAAVCRALADDPAARGGAVEFARALRHAGTSVAVEFTAGRPVPDPVPHPASAARPEVGTEAASSPAAPGRPAFARPGPVVVPVGEPPTRLMGSRPRPQIPRGVARRRRGHRPLPVALLEDGGPPSRGRPGRHRPPDRAGRGRAPWRVAVALGGAGALVTGAVLLATPGSDVPAVGATWAGRAGNPRPHSAALSSPTAHAATAPRPAARTRVTPARDTATWLGLLRRLDSVRAQAWADRRPALLAGVYAADLAGQDAARLRAAVPVGCGLRGATTEYRTLAARAAGGRATLVVLARLRPSRLVCGGRYGGAAAGTAAVRLHVELALTRDGPRIVAERTV